MVSPPEGFFVLVNPTDTMDEPLIEDEKPFEVEGMAEEETLPDPDEQLLLHQGNGRVWLVKVSPQPCRPYYDSL